MSLFNSFARIYFSGKNWFLLMFCSLASIFPNKCSRSSRGFFYSVLSKAALMKKHLLMAKLLKNHSDKPFWYKTDKIVHGRTLQWVVVSRDARLLVIWRFPEHVEQGHGTLRVHFCTGWGSLVGFTKFFCFYIVMEMVRRRFLRRE